MWTVHSKQLSNTTPSPAQALSAENLMSAHFLGITPLIFSAKAIYS